MYYYIRKTLNAELLLVMEYYCNRVLWLLSKVFEHAFHHRYKCSYSVNDTDCVCGITHQDVFVLFSVKITNATTI